MDDINSNILKPVYYSANGILGTGALWYIVFSDRSDGKTFNIKERALRRYYKTKERTVYVRRWKTEFTPSMRTDFLDEIFEKKPELKPKRNFNIKADKSALYWKWDRGWEPMIYFVPLSISSRLKSVLDPLHIAEIDFDEYFPLDGRYVPDEMTQLLELWNTCDRKRFKVKLGIFGNRIEGTAPCLKFFGVGKDIGKPGIKVYKNGALAVQSYSNETNKKIVEESPFMDLIKGTEYESYMQGGILKLSKLKRANVPDTATIWAGIKTENGIGSFWYDGEQLYIADKKVKGVLTLTDKPYADLYGEQMPAQEPGIKNFLKRMYYQNLICIKDDNSWEIAKPLFKQIIIT